MQPSFSLLPSGRAEQGRAPSERWRWIDFANFAIERSRLAFAIGLRRFPALRCRLFCRRDPTLPGHGANQRSRRDRHLFANRALSLYQTVMWEEKPEPEIPAYYLSSLRLWRL